MLSNIGLQSDLSGLARRKARSYETKTINEALFPEYESKGWVLLRKNKKSIQIKKDKSHNVLLEDNVWMLFYKMGFQYLSMEGGCKVQMGSTSDAPTSQIDVVAIDEEIAIAIECRSSNELANRPQFQSDLGKFVLTKNSFTQSVRKHFDSHPKKQIIYGMVLSKIRLSDNDKERAKKENVILFDERDLEYYRNLVSHLGPAAKYQILSDMLPGKEVPGLSIRVPAIKTKMGGDTCYNFSISPEYLLKISYVSHRSKGKQSDINTYQRMLAKSRLSKIRDYITNDGIFPTNIILNFEKNKLQFQRTRQETDTDTIEIGTLGWLDIRPAYKSAWIIDGQHRLFAFSGHERALKSKLSVLAFEGLPASKQAQMFIDINSKQKAVKQSLLQELYAELHWDADEPETRVKAIVSKSIQDLNSDPDCALYQRIQSTDGSKDLVKCITLSSLFGQIEKKGFHIAKEKSGHVVEFGPLWAGDDNHKTLKRTVYVLKFLFNKIKEKNQEWWNKGADQGGGLAMNDGVAACVNILRSIFDFLESQGKKLVHLDDKELTKAIEPYVSALADYLYSLDEQQKKFFRDQRGGAGILTRTRKCQEGMRKIIHGFNPVGLDEWIKTQEQQTNLQAKTIIDEIELKLKDTVIDELKREFGLEESGWWVNGIPKAIRVSISQRREEEDGKRGGVEHYFDLIHYKKIISDNWNLFKDIFGYGKGNKDKQSEWIGEINEMRKIVSHASSGKMVSMEELQKLQTYHEWLKEQVSKSIEPNVS
jgi:DNA sulfur modification protein DndB